jgi:MFS family permease
MSSETSLDNWIDQLDLTCADKSSMGIIGSAYFVGFLLSMFIIPRWADLSGRRLPVLACQLLYLPVNLYLFYMTEVREAAVCMFLTGFALCGCVTVNSIYV